MTRLINNRFPLGAKYLVKHFMNITSLNEKLTQLRFLFQNWNMLVNHDHIVAEEYFMVGSLADAASFRCSLKVELTWDKNFLLSHATLARGHVHAVVAVFEAISRVILNGWRAPW